MKAWEIVAREYHNREMAGLVRQLDAINNAPLTDRKAAAAEWGEALRTPALVAERVGWLLNGSYGYGACYRAAQIQAAKRGNRAAQAALLVAAVEWQCPATLATVEWKKLTKDEQDSLAAAILAELAETESAVTLED